MEREDGGEIVPTSEKRLDIELIFEDGSATPTITSSMARVSLCFERGSQRFLEDRSDPQVLLVVCKVSGDHCHEVWRDLRPLRDLVWHVPFDSCGEHRVTAMVFGTSEAAATQLRRALLDEGYHSYCRKVVDWKGNASGDINALLDDCSDVVFGHVSRKVVIPEEALDHIPAWERRWLDFLLAPTFGKVDNKCSVWRRRLFAYTIQPPMVVLMAVVLVLLRLLIVVARFSVPLGADMKPIFRPWFYDTADIWKHHDQGVLLYFSRDHVRENFSNCLEYPTILPFVDEPRRGRIKHNEKDVGILRRLFEFRGEESAILPFLLPFSPLFLGVITFLMYWATQNQSGADGVKVVETMSLFSAGTGALIFSCVLSAIILLLPLCIQALLLVVVGGITLVGITWRGTRWLGARVLIGPVAWIFERAIVPTCHAIAQFARPYLEPRIKDLNERLEALADPAKRRELEWKEKQRVRALTHEQARKDFDLLTCQVGGRTIAARMAHVPKEKRTIQFRYNELKADTCKPLSSS